MNVSEFMGDYTNIMPSGWKPLALRTYFKTLALAAISPYSGSRLSEVQEPHPQPPPRKRGGGYDVPHVIRKRYFT
jgi:hypothetical protein